MLTTEQTGQIDTKQVKIEILAPSPELAMSGAGGKDSTCEIAGPKSQIQAAGF
ncbi:MAG TPA: hypothetical protein VGL94_10505 [Ktedonobacteraceae bacterium]